MLLLRIINICKFKKDSVDEEYTKINILEEFYDKMIIFKLNFFKA